ncbi:MAG: class I SAM-dependent methyltransferase [Bdellovibrionales bacterium]|nr:class I SAM-dependent methyltransferase [Bdellovibrionales bacterium]
MKRRVTLAAKIASALPPGVSRPLLRLKDYAIAARYAGTGRDCPVCGRSSRRFRPFGNPPREQARCAHCTALERHRFVWLFLQRKTDFFDERSRRMLHIAPERCFAERFRRAIGDGYLSADLTNRAAMERMDITDINYPDRTFDIIYCSHVLEHVFDDRQALRELRRVLKEDGWALLQVPDSAERTMEDPAIATPAERLAAYGHEEHFRLYGEDFAERAREEGFRVSVVKVRDLALADAEIETMGLGTATGNIYYCTKRSP